VGVPSMVQFQRVQAAATSPGSRFSHSCVPPRPPVGL
jgi:hypothetical protein